MATPRPTLCPPVVVPTDGPKTPQTPDLRPDAERQAEIDAARARRTDCRVAWSQDTEFSNLPWGKLVHKASTGDPAPPEYHTLTAAAAAADVIVAGTVTSVTVTPLANGSPEGRNLRVTATITVDTPVKGASAGPLDVNQGSTVQPTLDWKSAEIVDYPWSPFLVPEERVVLLLERDKDGELYPQSFTGTYLVTGGKVTAIAALGMDLADLRSQATGLPEADFVALLR